MVGMTPMRPKCFETDCTDDLKCVRRRRFFRATTRITAGQRLRGMLEKADGGGTVNGNRNVSRRSAILLPGVVRAIFAGAPRFVVSC
jgi:hypothetical protein